MKRFKKGVIALAAAVSAVGGMAALDVQPAQAAATMSVCLRGRIGPLSGIYVTSQLYYNNTWNISQQVATSNNGCVTFYQNGWTRNYYGRIVVNHHAYGYRYAYTSANWAYPGNQAANFGTIYPTCIPKQPGYCI